ncbi:MAG: F0F1 ATP synthase subunit alpha, partial [Chloroflexi bacterium]
LTEILKQPQYEPMSLEHQVMAIYAGTRGFIDHVPVNQVKAWENDFHRFMDTQYPDVGEAIAREKVLTPEIEARLREAIEAFNRTWGTGG